MAVKSYEKLMSPGKIGKVTTRNRIIKTGAGTFMWHEDETSMNDVIKAYYESLARGGVGLLIVESPTIDWPRGCRWRDRYRLDDDRYTKGISELATIIHKYGCPTFMQMNHDGPWETKLGLAGDPPPNEYPIGASATTLDSPNDFHHEPPHPLTIEEIQVIIDKFASAAVRASEAGFDGVDINAASSHLFHNFLSPYWNRREDEYGGSVENRARIVVETVKEIKKRLGNDFPVSVCINGIELGRLAGVDDATCQTSANAIETAKLLEAAGVDNLHIRSHWLGYHVGAYLTDVFFYPEAPIPLKDFPPEYNATQHGAAANVRLAGMIKKSVSIPVMTVGRFDADLGEKAIAEGCCDFIGMTRRLQADPEYPNKIKEGRLDDIAPCTACENCLGTRRCRINAFMGAPYNKIEKAAKQKKVVVIGAGPAGLEAARVAALRGHQVHLYEKSSKPGGLVPLAAMVKGMELEDLPSIIKYLDGQVRKLGVNINYGKEATAELILASRPDTVILATGGKYASPDIPGIDRKRVVSNAALHKQLKLYLKFFSPQLLRSITKFWMPVGKQVVIIGSGLHGLELAEYLTKRGRKVTVVDSAKQPGESMVDALLGHLMAWFGRKGTAVINGVTELKILDDGVTFIDAKGKRTTLKADTIIPALPMVPDNSLAETLKGKVPEVIQVGDCKEPLLIADAIGTGLRSIREI